MTIKNANLQFRGVSPNGGKQKKIDTIVLHHRAGNGDVQSIHQDHMAKGWWGIGYHYYIRKNGEIWRGREEQWVGSHAGSSNDYNKHSIGICFEGNFEEETMTDAQVEAGRELIADIKKRHKIKQVLGHKDVAATACPGRNFRWEEIMAQETNLDIGAFVRTLTPAECYYIVEQANKYAAKLKPPDWADEELGQAMDDGITDGTRPMCFIPRYQAALMSDRAYRNGLEDAISLQKGVKDD